MDLSIIIVNYKSRLKLLNCLKSIREADSGGLKYEIIIVDNFSGDDFSDRSGVKVVNSRANLGMGGGNNLGLAQAAGKYILILNPDTIIRGQAIKIMFDYLEAHPSVGMVGPKLLYPDGTLQYSCARWPHFFMPILRRTFLGDFFAPSRDHFMMVDFNHDSVRPVDWLMGSCLMFRKTISLPQTTFQPRFDERYFMYFEDTDLARQFWSRGLSVVYNPEAIVVHDHQRQSAKHPWYLAIFLDSLAWHHIGSWLKYFIKWGIMNKDYAQD